MIRTKAEETPAIAKIQPITISEDELIQINNLFRVKGTDGRGRKKKIQ